MKNKYRLIAGLLAILIATIACGGSSEKAKPEKVDSGDASVVETIAEPTATEEKKVFGLGETVKFKSLQITLSNLGDEPPGTYIKPADGFKWIKFDILFENVGDDSQYVDNHNFKLIGPDGSQYDAKSMNDISWDNANLLPGTRKQTAVGFEIPIDQSGFKVIYQANSFNSDELIYFDLGF